MPSEVGSATFSSSMVTNLPEPTLVHDVGVNALNYCAYDMTLTKGDNLTSVSYTHLTLPTKA